MIQDIIVSLITTAICFIAKNIYTAVKSQERDKQEFSISMIKKCSIQFFLCLGIIILTYIFKSKITNILFLGDLFNVLFFMSAFLIWGAFDVLRAMLHDIEKDKKDNSWNNCGYNSSHPPALSVFLFLAFT